MKKILFITAFYKPYIFGGAEISNQLLIEGMILNSKNNIRVCTIGEKNQTFGYIKKIYVNNLLKKFLIDKLLKRQEKKSQKIKRFLYKLSTYFSTKKIKDIVNSNLEEKVNIVHTSGINYFFPHIWWKISKHKNYMVVHTLRDPILIYSKLKKEKGIIKIYDYFHRKYYIKYVEKYVDYVHSPTQYMIDLHIKNGFKFKNTKVIPNTLNVNFEISDYDNKIYDLVYVGTLSESKGVKTLIKLKEENSFLNIVFVGEGILSENAKNVGIQVTGWLQQSEVFEWIRKSKILVLPSEWEEAFGRVLIEGIALGTISIGSNMGGIPEVLFNDTRYIFEARNIVELNQKIERVLSLNEIEYTKELLRLQEKIQIYKYENHIKQFEEFYDEILKNRG